MTSAIIFSIIHTKRLTFRMVAEFWFLSIAYAPLPIIFFLLFAGASITVLKKLYHRGFDFVFLVLFLMSISCFCKKIKIVQILTYIKVKVVSHSLAVWNMIVGFNDPMIASVRVLVFFFPAGIFQACTFDTVMVSWYVTF